MPEDEMYCRYVIEYYQVTYQQSEKCSEIVNRLNNELERQLHMTNGAIHLLD
jgi:hypothetical protein